MDFAKLYNLEKENIKYLEFKNENDWHELRTHGIGGSDIGAIMGLNEYTSPLQIFKAKMGEPKNSDNEFTRRGKDLEDIIRERYFKPFMKNLGYDIIHPEVTMVNEEYPWLRANLDGFAVSLDRDPLKNKVIEIKYVSSGAQAKWDGKEYDGIPASYYAQVQEYMLVTNSNEAYLGALFDKGWEFKVYKIIRDEIFINKLIKMSKEFYEFNMRFKIPPKIDFTLDKEEAYEALAKDSPVMIKNNNEFDELCMNFKLLNEESKSIENRKKALRQEILYMYNEGYRTTDDNVKVSVSTYETTSFDSLSFGAQYPDLYSKFIKKNNQFRLTIK